MPTTYKTELHISLIFYNPVKVAITGLWNIRKSPVAIKIKNIEIDEFTTQYCLAFQTLLAPICVPIVEAAVACNPRGSMNKKPKILKITI